MVKVSIVIPFYKNKELLVEMIDSILYQQFDDWELLLIDDGADVETIDRVHKYEESDVRIRIIKRNRLPKGAQTCRNIGMKNASGEYVCFFDSDDILLPYCLGNRVQFMDENKDLDFAVFRAHTYDIKEKTKCQILGAKKTSDDIKYFVNGVLPFAVWTNIYRRKSLEKSGTRWDENILSLQDSDFNIQNIVRKKMKYSYYEGNEPDYLWRINHSGDSITKRIQSIRHNNSNLYFIDKLIKTIHANYGIEYDSNLALRIHDFCLIFAENFDFESVKSLINIGLDNHIEVLNYRRYKVYSKLNKGFFGKILKIAIFPRYTYLRHRIVKKFYAETGNV